MFYSISKLSTTLKSTIANNPAERQPSRYFSSTSRMSIDNNVKTEAYQYKFHNFNNEMLELFQTKDNNISDKKNLST